MLPSRRLVIDVRGVTTVEYLLLSCIGLLAIGAIAGLERGVSRIGAGRDAVVTTSALGRDRLVGGRALDEVGVGGTRGALTGETKPPYAPRSAATRPAAKLTREEHLRARDARIAALDGRDRPTVRREHARERLHRRRDRARAPSASRSSLATERVEAEALATEAARRATSPAGAAPPTLAISETGGPAGGSAAPLAEVEACDGFCAAWRFLARVGRAIWSALGATGAWLASAVVTDASAHTVAPRPVVPEAASDPEPAALASTEAAIVPGTAASIETPPPPPPPATTREARLRRIRDIASAEGITNAVLIAGLAQAETGVVQCWADARWACKGPASAECGGGATIAGSADGACHLRRGGLGMFQLDAGSHRDTVVRHGEQVLTLDGNVRVAIDFAVEMVMRSRYVRVSTVEEAKAFISSAVPGTKAFDQWIKTVTHYYNGCSPSYCGVYHQRSRHYRAAALYVARERGRSFWTPSASISELQASRMEAGRAPGGS